ncbi:hypothetical protein GUJ93_ZPchr0005g15665 [Zizania palustris]|uniref:Cullin family profile domain-containing protein n=1 Tax=Zizania palustris TaxID=103762 RepID=A0A8J5SXU5_ZIZPA|nr:hypothetical protein GUJ93_ZPchr0005g15665 [Zizania palustris]
MIQVVRLLAYISDTDLFAEFYRKKYARRFLFDKSANDEHERRFWPSYKTFDINLPAEMVRCVEVFKEFYQTITKHRKLTWIYSLGTCVEFSRAARFQRSDAMMMFGPTLEDMQALVDLQQVVANLRAHLGLAPVASMLSGFPHGATARSFHDSTNGDVVDLVQQ